MLAILNAREITAVLTFGIAAILAEAKNAGKAYGKGLSPWLASNYPDMAEAVAQQARTEFAKDRKDV